MIKKNKIFFVKLERPQSRCRCSAKPCSRDRIVAKWGKTGSGRWGYVRKSHRHICEDCYNKEIARICQKSLCRWHEGFEE